VVALRIVGLVDGSPSPFDGLYLVEYDPDRPGVSPDGRPMLAHIVATAERPQAREFPNALEAMKCWRTVSRTWPMRSDGQPNRPLTAFTVEVA
jgi:hypothetical protein